MMTKLHLPSSKERKTSPNRYLAVVGQNPGFLVLDNHCPRCTAELLETPSGFVCQNCPSGLFPKVRITMKIQSVLSDDRRISHEQLEEN
jgi:DNA-directed RNA polymerase subunit RPC12/RpoP